MKHRFFSGVSLLSLSLMGCGSEPPPVMPTRAIAPPPVVAKVAAPLLQIPNAQASVKLPKTNDALWKQDFRSQGSTHILAGSSERVVIVSADRGVEGFLRPPVAGKIRWAGFSKNDAVLVLIGTTLFRAADSAAAVAGKFTALPSVVDERFTHIASDKNIFVAGAPDDTYVESTNGGTTLRPAKLGSKDPLAQLVVRSDGVIIAAHELARKPGKYGGTTIHAQLFVKSSTNGKWTKGPLVESSDEPLSLSGDAVEAIEIKDNQKFEVDGEETVVGLDAKRNWVHTAWSRPWLQLWPSESFEPSVQPPRPHMAVSGAKDDAADLLVGGLMGSQSSTCSGVDCLANRKARGPSPTVQAWDDATCDASAVVGRDEEITVSGLDGAPEKKETIHHDECDEKKSASRTAALFLSSNDVFAAPRLPRSCPSGHVTGTDAWPIVACGVSYGGIAQLLSVDANGTITPMLAALHVALKNPTAERASDGTTILNSEEQLLLCDAKSRSCAALARGERFLAAMPIDGGRALVLARGADANELAITVVGTTATPLVRVQVAEHLLDASITSDGNLRLWTHPQQHNQVSAAGWRQLKDRAQLHAWLVRADGSLDSDPNAVTKFLATPPEAGDPK
ncbi:MAG: hypothetical protein ABI461_21230, partial [Polyangiaceae bacterium]